MKKSIIFLLLILPFLLFSQDDKTDFVKRSIVIFPFINNSTEEFEYLKITINDALRIKLRETGKYNIVDYNQIDKSQLEGIYSEDRVFDLNEVKLLSISIGSDAALIGDYSIENEEIKINLKAIDILTGEVVADLTKTGSTGLALFDIINTSVAEVSDEILAKIESVRKDYYEKQIKEQEKQLRIAKRNEMLKKSKQPTLGENLTPEGDFEDLYKNHMWRTWYQYRESIIVSSVFINGKALIEVNNVLGEQYIEFSRAGITLEKGKTYRVNFQARASKSMNLYLALDLGSAPWTNYHSEKSFRLTKEMKEYSYSFKMKDKTNYASRLKIMIKIGDCEVYLDNISVFEE